VLAFVSNYLVGGLVGHRYTALYGPHGIDVRETVKAIEGHRDLVRGIKAHGEVGGYSRWGVETLRLAKEASRQARVPVYVHLGRLWAEVDGTRIDPDVVVPEVVPLDPAMSPSLRTPGPSSRARVRSIRSSSRRSGAGCASTWVAAAT
jgi:dihydroorotase